MMDEVKEPEKISTTSLANRCDIQIVYRDEIRTKGLSRRSVAVNKTFSEVVF